MESIIQYNWYSYIQGKWIEWLAHVEMTPSDFLHSLPGRCTSEENRWQHKHKKTAVNFISSHTKLCENFPSQSSAFPLIWCKQNHKRYCHLLLTHFITQQLSQRRDILADNTIMLLLHSILMCNTQYCLNDDISLFTGCCVNLIVQSPHLCMYFCNRQK